MTMLVISKPFLNFCFAVSVVVIFSCNISAQKTTKKPGLGGSSVDNDPHFIVQLKGASHPVCFDVTGKDGDVYQLVSDPDKQFFVNGRIFGVNVTKNGRSEHRTYFGNITVIKKSLRIVITPTKIKIHNRKGQRAIRLPWKKNHPTQEVSSGVRVSVKRQGNVTVYLGDDIVLAVAKHRHRRMRLKFLGVYLLQGSGLSQNTGGLIGEFQYKTVKERVHRDQQHATLTVLTTAGAKTARVHLGSRMNMAQKVHVTCWRVPNNHSGVLDYSHNAYLVPEMTSSRQAWKGSYFMAF